MMPRLPLCHEALALTALPAPGSDVDDLFYHAFYQLLPKRRRTVELVAQTLEHQSLARNVRILLRVVPVLLELEKRDLPLPARERERLMVEQAGDPVRDLLGQVKVRAGPHVDLVVPVEQRHDIVGLRPVIERCDGREPNELPGRPRDYEGLPTHPGGELHVGLQLEFHGRPDRLPKVLAAL